MSTLTEPLVPATTLLRSARIVNCWTGQGGLPGRPHRENAGKIVVDFEGERFSGLDYRSPVEPAVNISNGVLLNSGCYPVAGQKNYWRLILDRSEEHTSELQSLMRISYAVFCLKNKK